MEEADHQQGGERGINVDTVESELRRRRLVWLKEIFENTRENKQLRAAVVGVMQGDGQAEGEDWNPWVEQICRDLEI